jgi:cell wall-associated NlpC family hydrolase
MIPETALAAFKADVLNRWPQEACGFVVDGNYIPAPNSAAEPLQDFRISALDRMRIVGDRKIDAVLHSHPYRIDAAPKYPAQWPSTKDMETYLTMQVPWGIVSTEGETTSDVVWLDDDLILNTPLEGRTFTHGVFDCYSAIRSWFWQERQIRLPDFARGMDWWDETGKDLYDTNFENVGFKTVQPEDVTVGDCVMVRIRSSVVNHAAVVTGPASVYHHAFGRLSGHDEGWLQKWNKHIVRCVRYQAS